MEKDSMMGKCGHKIDYSEKYDSYFCPVCNVWTEKRCPDENCIFCKDRPDKPICKKMDIKDWMVKNWGKRCKDYNEECSLCRAWDCYDYLTKLGSYPLPPKKRNVTEVAKFIKSI